ncbi:MAG: 3-oxoacyl-ACP reductase FabG [Enterobacteriaceae bacterium]
MKNKKIALVTGASKGIGLSILKKFVKKNIFTIGTSRTKSGIHKINKISKNMCRGYILDLSLKRSIKSFIKKIKKKKKIDILVNNAGIRIDKYLINMKEKDWNNVINVNLKSIFKISKHIVKLMIKNKYGKIINISSSSGFLGNIGQTNYSSSKIGIVGFSKSLAKELALKNINVNVVSPGFIKSEMTKNIPKIRKKEILNNIPMKKFGNPEDVANAVYFLSSNESSYITGTTIHVNGGLYM